MPVSYGFLQFQNGMPLERTQNVLYAGFLGVIICIKCGQQVSLECQGVK